MRLLSRSASSSCASDMEVESPRELPTSSSSSSSRRRHGDGASASSPGLGTSSCSTMPPPAEPRLRGLRWRVMLGVLPCSTSPASPIPELRRAAANGRRRYAELRRRLIIDPHTIEDSQKANNVHVDNPLSQDPKSIWGRYFENSKVEGTINTDLARLYPEEHGSFFQSKTCQAILKRVLLVWALIHPQYGYQQGMHELLAPLVYVLHMDIEQLNRVRKRYKDPFEDSFDVGMGEDAPHNTSTEARQILPIFTSHSLDESSIHGNGKDWLQRLHPEDAALLEPDDFGFSLETMLSGSDSYGAEGELGALMSARFLEHDAYCLFDALLKGNNSSLVLADYYVVANEGRSSGISPMLEASANMYETLSAVDMPLYVHLVGLGVEPQFFALRWFRVLFGREFALAELLFIWDAIFALPSTSHGHGDSVTSPGSNRSAFVSHFAVSMLLHLRSALLATSDAASCLQKVLNFPKSVDVKLLIENTKALEQSKDDVSKSTLSKKIWGFTQLFSQKNQTKHKSWSGSPFQAHIPAAIKGLHRNSPDVKKVVPESYWEERWMNSVLPKASLPAARSNDTMDGKNSQPEAQHNGDDLGVEQNLGDAGPNQKLTKDASGKHTQPLAPSPRLDPGVEKTSGNAVGSNLKPTQYHFSGNVHTRTRRKLFATPDVVDPLGVTLQGSDRSELWMSDAETSTSGDDSESQSFLAKDTNPAASGMVNSGRLRCHDQTPTIISSSSHLADDPEAALRTLGHSMLDNIKVLENALAQKANLGREGASTAFRETMDSFSKAFSSSKGQTAAMSALGELRKISNMLLQM